MKRTLIQLAALLCWINAGAVELPNSGSDAIVPAPWQPAEAGPDSRVWRKQVTGAMPDAVATEGPSYVEMATGLNYWRNNQWNVAEDVLELTPDGAAWGTKAQYQVRLSPNINTLGSTALTTPDNTVILSHLAGIGYADRGQYVLLATLKDSVGRLSPPNIVIYPDALVGYLRGDLVFTFRKGSLEADVIFRESPPPCTEFGMDPKTAKIEIWHEFINAPEPRITRAFEINGATDDRIEFSQMRFGHGTAFMTGAGGHRENGLQVFKSWVAENDRRFLVESVPYEAAARKLNALPRAQAAVGAKKVDRMAMIHSLPIRSAARKANERIQMAKVEPFGGNGFVWDYIQIPNNSNQTNYVFRGDTTYLISGSLPCWQNTIFEGGAVIKYVATNDAQILLDDNVEFKNTPYTPVIFTSRNDRTVGEDLYLAGTLTNYYQALVVYASVVNEEVKNIRVCYATNGVNAWGVNLHDAQFLHCQQAISMSVSYMNHDVNNVLLYDCALAFGGVGYHAKARQITAHKVGFLTHDPQFSSNSVTTIAFTNCLFSQITSNGVVPMTTNSCVWDDGTNVFQTVGAGMHYLADDSEYRGAGTSEIPDWLATNLLSKSTSPPMLWTNDILEDMTFDTVVQRCDDVPSIGYQYPSLDYLITSVMISNASLTILPGTAVAVYGTNGFTIKGPVGELVSDGMPLERNHIVPFYAVQEQTTNLSGGTLMVSNTLVSAGSTNASARLRFTDFDGVAGFGRHLFADNTNRPFSALSVRDCTFNSGRFDVAGKSANVHGFTNNVFLRVAAVLSKDATVSFYNNYVFGSTGFKFLSSGVNEWIVKDNFFDDSVQTNERPANFVNGFNGYRSVPTADRIKPEKESDVIVGGNFQFATGPLGNLYHDGTVFWNYGSRRATNGGMYHYTSQVDQTLEAGSLIDIGFHYIALGTNGEYLDVDQDELPTFYEDENGNGVFDSASEDTDLNNPDTLGMATLDNQLVLKFEFKTPANDQQPEGNLITNTGFRIYSEGRQHSGPNGILLFFFDRRHNGMQLNEWKTDGSDTAWTFEFHLDGTKTPGTWLGSLSPGTWYKYNLCHDRQRFSLMVRTIGNTLVFSNTFWRDNMAEQFGSGGVNKMPWVNPNYLGDANYVRNVSRTKWMKKKLPKEVWQGVIGNTSRDPVGPTVHATWWPIKKIVSRGTNVYYTGGFNESKFDLQRFSTEFPQVVLTNFSRDNERRQAPEGASPMIPVDLIIKDDGYLYVKHSDGSQDLYHKFNVDDPAIREAASSGDWTPPSPGNVSIEGATAYAVHPTDETQVAVYRRDTDQVEVYDNATTTPVLRFAIGQAYGYANGPSIMTENMEESFRTGVKLGGYYFDKPRTSTAWTRVESVALCFQDDGKLWVGDTITSRLFRFDTDGHWDGTTVMFVAHAYTACVDPNNTRRVFMGSLEFDVDHSLLPKSKGAWKLVNYWGRYSAPPHDEIERFDIHNGLFHVTTFPNGRAYALTYQPGTGLEEGNPVKKRLVELVSGQGLRPVSGGSVVNLSANSEIEADGAILREANGTFYRGFVSNIAADPQYTEQTLASVLYNPTTDPIPALIKTNATRIFVFHASKYVNDDGTQGEFSGKHLGAINKTGGWQWRKSDTGDLDGKGNFANNASQPGGVIGVIDNNVIYGYRGEQWTGPLHSGEVQQANQFMRFRTSDGAFIDQFGLPRRADSWDNRPGAAGNVHNFSVVKGADGRIYLFTSDEWSHGIHRWWIK